MIVGKCAYCGDNVIRGMRYSGCLNTRGCPQSPDCGFDGPQPEPEEGTYVLRYNYKVKKGTDNTSRKDLPVRPPRQSLWQALFGG